MVWLKADKSAVSCSFRIGQVRDLRTDPAIMGNMGGRVVQMDDSIAWMNSGLAALAGDARLTLVRGADPADLTLNVEIVKAYIATMTVDKLSAIVVHVRIETAAGNPAPQTLRGSDTDLNWANGTEETQSALDRAMADLLRQIDLAVLNACAAR